MAKKTRKGYRKGSVLKRTGLRDQKTGLWTKRDMKTGQFRSATKSGGTFKGIKRQK